MILGSSQVIREQPENHLLKKYYMLRAISIGGMKDLEGMKFALEELRSKFPDTEESVKAGELLAALSGVGEPKATEKPKETVDFKESEAEHYFTLIFPKDEANLNFVKAKISDFNRKFFRNGNLKVTASLLDENTQVVLVNLFKSKDDALEYHSVYEQNKGDLDGVNDKGFVALPIAPNNYSTLFKTKEVEAYVIFFNKAYK